MATSPAIATPPVHGMPPTPAIDVRRQALEWVARPERLMRRALAECGDPFTLHLPFGPIAFVSDPAAIKRVFTGDPAVLRAGEGNSPLEPVVGPRSVLLLDGPAHLRQRRLLLPPFHGDRLGAYARDMRAITLDDVARWPRGAAFPLEPRTRAITLDIILRIVFGIEDAARLAELRGLFAAMLPAGMGRLALLPLFRRRGFRPWARFLQVRERIDAVLHDEIARRRADEAGLAEREDIMSMLVLARSEDGQPMTDGELRDELITLLLAGHETTATALAWTFELLLRHRAAHERARGDAAYREAVLQEALRLRPPLPMVVRRLAEPFAVAGYELPPGVRVGPCIWLAHRNPATYPDPDAFRPERFLEDPPETYTWLPFGGGIRRCVGASFAQMEMRIVLETVLETVRLRPASHRPEGSRRRAIVLAPSRGARAVAA